MKAGKRVALVGLLAALSVGLGALERFVPLGAVIPLPGVKLGLANLITVYAIYRLSASDALGVLTVRCLVSALLFGSPVSLAMSLSGGLLACIGMWLAHKLPRVFSVYGVSLMGAALHNIGQIFCAALWLQSAAVFAYLPVLLLVSLVTGALIGLISDLLLVRL